MILFPLFGADDDFTVALRDVQVHALRSGARNPDRIGRRELAYHPQAAGIRIGDTDTDGTCLLYTSMFSSAYSSLAR